MADDIAATLAAMQDRLDDLDAIRLRRHSMAEESVNLKLHAITEDFCRLLRVAEAALKLTGEWKTFAARGDAQDECADMLRETIAAALGGPATIEDVVADSIEQQSAYRNELRHLPGYLSSKESPRTSAPRAGED